MWEEAQGTEMSMLYSVTELGDVLQQRVVHTHLLSTSLRWAQDTTASVCHNERTGEIRNRNVG